MEVTQYWERERKERATCRVCIQSEGSSTAANDSSEGTGGESSQRTGQCCRLMRACDCIDVDMLYNVTNIMPSDYMYIVQITQNAD